MKTASFLILIAALSATACAAPAKSSAAEELGPPNALVLDVRTPAEYAAGRIPGAVLFPFDEIERRAVDFAALIGPEGKERPLVVYCRSGNRSSIALRTLKSLGYTNVVDYGGIGRWKGPLER